MYGLAACDHTGRCVGFVCQKKNSTKNFILDDLTKIRILEQDKNYEMDDFKLLTFKKKGDTNEIVLQNNLGHLLLPNGNPYRYVAIKV